MHVSGASQCPQPNAARRVTLPMRIQKVSHLTTDRTLNLAKSFGGNSPIFLVLRKGPHCC